MSFVFGAVALPNSSQRASARARDHDDKEFIKFRDRDSFSMPSALFPASMKTNGSLRMNDEASKRQFGRPFNEQTETNRSSFVGGRRPAPVGPPEFKVGQH